MEIPKSYDWSTYQTGELVCALRESSKGMFDLLQSQMKNQEERTPNVPAIVSIIKTVGFFDLYNYLARQERVASAVGTATIISASIVRGIPVAEVPLRHCGVVKARNTEDLVKACQDLGEQDWLESRPRHKAASTTIAFDLKDKGIVVAPVVQGEPLFTQKAQEVLAQAGMPIEVNAAEEVAAAQAIVDVAVYETKSGMREKTSTAHNDLFAAVQSEKKALIAYTSSVLHKAFRVNTSLKGLQLYTTLLTILHHARTSGSQGEKEARLDLLQRWTKWLQTPRPLRAPAKIGDYKRGELEYSYQLLATMRGVRGGDDRDNTAVGYSTYLPVNVPRAVVKSLVRVSDMVRIMALQKTSSIGIRGTAARKFVDALIAVNPKSVKLVGGPPAQYPGWTETDGVFTSPHHNFKIVTDAGECETIVDVDILERKDPTNISSYQQRKYIQMIRTPLDYTSSRFLPSVATHSLVGYLFPEETTLRTPTTYLACADAINIARTYPGHYRIRACEIQEKYGLPKVNFLSLWKYLKTVQSVGFDLLMEGGAIDFENMQDFLPADRLAEMAKKVEDLRVKAAAEEDDTVSFSLFDDDPVVETQDKKPGRAPLVVITDAYNDDNAFI